MPPPRTPPAVLTDTLAGRAGLGLLLGIAGVGLRSILDPVLGESAPYLLQAVSVVVASLTAGYVGGFVAAGVAVAAAIFAPHRAVGFALGAGAPGAALLLLVSVLTVLVLQLARWREAERGLRRRDEEYRSLFENLPIGYSRQRIVTDDQGRPEDYVVLQVNRAFERMTGRPRAEVVGKRITAVFPGIHDTDLIQRCGEVTLGGPPLSLQQAASDGKVYEVTAFSPQPGEFVTLFGDATERARQAEQVRRRIEELEGLMEVAPVAIWVAHDRECRVVTGNRTANEISGAEPGENVSSSDRRVPASRITFLQGGREVAPEDLPLQVAAARGIEVRDSELQVVVPGGRRLYLWGHALPLRDASGEVRGAIGAFLDVTERHRHEEALAAANRAKDEFLGTLSHELRTPMNAILGWSHMIATGKVPPEHLKMATSAIVRNAEAQRQLVDDVLDMSRIIRGRFQIRVEPVTIVSVIEKAMESVQTAADAKSLRVRLVEPPGLPVIAADPDRLQQVFWNLLSNAIKFTPAGGGEITITVRQEGDGVAAVVTDPGEGISAEFLSRVFDRFSQADTSMTRAHGGLGLGLAIVRHLVELHGGTVSAESEGTGKGSSFHVYLPIQQGQEEPPWAGAAPAGKVVPFRP